MMDPVAESATLRHELIQAYTELPLLERQIVQLFSVIYEPINRNLFLTCLNFTSIRGTRGKLLTTQTLKPYLERLLDQAILQAQGGRGLQCHPLLVEVATRESLQLGLFEEMVLAVQTHLPIPARWKNGPRAIGSEEKLLREARIGLYRGDLKFIQKQIADYQAYRYHHDLLDEAEVLEIICNNPFDPTWFRTLPNEIYEPALTAILNEAMLSLLPADQALVMLQDDCQGARSVSVPLRVILIEHLILRNRLTEAQQVFDRLDPADQKLLGYLQAWLWFLQGENDRAIAQFTTALQTLKKASGKRKLYLVSMSGLFWILALLKRGNRESLQEALGYVAIAQQNQYWLSSLYRLLEVVIQVQLGDSSRKDQAFALASAVEMHTLGVLFSSLCLYWIDAERAKQSLPLILEAFCDQAEATGYDWVALEVSDLLARFKPRSKYGKQAKAWRQETGLPPLAEVISHREAWELSLNALIGLHQDLPGPTRSEPTQRLAWLIEAVRGGYQVHPKEQTLNAKGEWSRGRPIALKRLALPSNLDFLTAQDREVCSHIELKADPRYYGALQYHLGEEAIAALAGHPLVFWEDAPTQRIEIVKGEPELLVKKGRGEQLILQFAPALKDNQSLVIVKETPTRLKVIEVRPDHRRISEILGKQNRLEVPAKAKDQVLSAIQAVANLVTVHSDIGGGVALEEMPSDATPHLHLLPAGAGLKAALLVRPFAQSGPYYRPGSGGETVIAEIEGKRVQTTRNLREEKQRANAAIAACPTLSQQEQHHNEWLLEDPETCLELLLELQDLGETVHLEWPEGEKLRVNQQATLQNFQLTIKRQQDWFAVDGQLPLEDGQVLDMQRLMALLAETPSRFVPLGNGEFLALTQEFRKRLDELRAFSDSSKQGLRVHPLATLTMADWVDQVGDLKADKQWQAHLQRLTAMQTLEPQLPSTLQADLRDYQLEGFRWLARLAHWGVGACLADDMGLGKTLQSLAIILTRAPEGPTLIVAPTSVGMNWTSEAQRFAPTLNVLQFGTGNRQQMLDNLKPFDLLICTYGLLQQEEVAAMLAKVAWQTVVLDEAQSIKNFATKRSQAAMTLQAGFRLITTGTPIENHLGELWNLFRFINPGLLGSLEHFNQRFAIPIERWNDRQARQQLKTLIQPFLLRRTKQQVLQELPSRTEIVLQVELSPEEMAFYEALRREAIAKLADTDADVGPKHLQVLAEIMKLRRACCNVQLVTPKLSLPSAKLQLFQEVLEELLENRHKALVFSQFVDHLQLIRAHLDQQKIAYQYLDGSTSKSERKKRVDAFQAGAGDVFLISLKAGGTGLNLTAADYVIHMDPWWNPAVEDQASDRAHRIGQQRPVTIYRLVTQHTIEEKIVALHQQKRDLADSLLEGTDISGKISTEDLLRLLQEG